MKGFLRQDGEGVRITLTDAWGYVLELTGVKAEQDGVRGYALEGRLVTVPDELKVPWLDDDRDPAT